MTLPKLDYPIHEVFLKSQNKKVKFRPFLVKEEKILLIAKESEDVEEIKTSVKQIIKNCCIDNIDVDSLPLFDIEMFFINLRSRSIGETAKLNFTCKNQVEDNPCDTVTEYTINLNSVDYLVPKEHNNKIKLTDKVGIVFKYPTMSVIKDLEEDFYDATIRVFGDNIDYIYDESSIYPRKDLTDEEVQEFLEHLTSEQLDEVRNFFATTPRVILKDKITCSKCKFEHEIVVENLYSFFI